MPAIAHDVAAGAPHLTHDAAAGSGEDPGVERRIPLPAAQPFVVGIECQEIGQQTDADGATGPCRRLRTAGTDRLEQPASGRAFGIGQHRACTVAQTLRPFEHAQLIGEADAEIGIAADTEPAAGFEKSRRIEDAIAKIGLGDRAETYHRTARGKPTEFVHRRLGTMDRAPAAVDLHLVEQPGDWPGAVVGQDLLNFRLLFGEVDMDRTVGCKCHEHLQIAAADRPQRVRCQADAEIRRRLRQPPARSLEQAGKAFRIVAEASLRTGERPPVGTAEPIEHRQERQANAGPFGSRENAPRHLGGIGVGRAIGGVVQIMELGDRAETCLQHLDEGHGGDGFHLLRLEPFEKAIHGLAPSPEAVAAGGSARLGEPGHAALEGMAVQVHRRWQQQVHHLPVPIMRGTDRGNGAIGCDLDRHILPPAFRQKRAAGDETARTGHALRTSLTEYVHTYYERPRKRSSRGEGMAPARLLVDAEVATMAADGTPYGLIRDAAVVLVGERIAWVGPRRALPAEYADLAAESLGRRLVTPAPIDCHTHLVFAGNRAREFELRLRGASYAEIARAGGGIAATVEATRRADEATLLAGALRRVDCLLADGVGTIEIKSGYGLDVETELRLLRVARAIPRHRPVDVVTSFLGAHSVPPGTDADGYIDQVCLPALERAHAEGLVDAVDGFCERIAFTPEQIARLFRRARQLGLPVKLHAEQLSHSGGTKLAAQFGALSADHLEYAREDDVQALAAAGTVAVLLPGAFYTLREQQLPPVDALRRHRVPMAVATDWNPGTSPLGSLLLAANMACTLFRLTTEEALAGITRHAARALGLADRGVIAPGMRADLVVWDVEHPAELCYQIGVRCLARRIWRGEG